ERVAYFHFAQAYVRGPFRSSALSHPLVLAKCSHDLDLLRHYVGERCETVCSDGDTSFFIKENKPDFAAERCVDCRYKNECIYSAKKIYIDGWHKAGEPADGWPYSKITQSVPITEESLYEGIGSGMYGTCVFGGDNDTCDRQSVLMRFENGVIATLNIAVAAYPGRRINFFGSKGEILLDERKGTVDLYRFGDDPVSVSIDSIRENKSGHGGGDDNLVDVFYKVLCGEADTETSLEKSIESHRMGIAAEKSRKNGGIPIKVI
ncbi:MAG: gfo/Idh/MocA family oxidoreductase, partial [Firmicutes bacterium]|nr:gfo/Idh/MocA family oxidoreductase [Candidatus Colimorpha enterica]